MFLQIFSNMNVIRAQAENVPVFLLYTTYVSPFTNRY